eukprot:jgi/Chrzof1/1470/Cz10g09030.t1
MSSCWDKHQSFTVQQEHDAMQHQSFSLQLENDQTVGAFVVTPSDSRAPFPSGTSILGSRCVGKPPLAPPLAGGASTHDVITCWSAGERVKWLHSFWVAKAGTFSWCNLSVGNYWAVIA